MSDPLKDLNTVAKAINNANKATGKIGRKWQAVKQTIGLILSPIWLIVGPVFRFAKRHYGHVFNKYAYTTDELGERILVPKRAAITIVVLLLITWLAYSAIKPLYVTVVDVVRLNMVNEYTLYFGKPQFKATADLYQVTACKSRDNCEGGDNALIFDIPDNFALDWKYTFTKGRGYDPEYDIVSSFNSEFQQCTVHATREHPVIYNFIVGKIRWNPKILGKAICKPVVE